MTDDPFRHAAHEEPLKISSSMASDNDQVGMLLFCRVHDGLIQRADDRYALCVDALFRREL
jgi:hypothetical protein